MPRYRYSATPESEVTSKRLLGKCRRSLHRGAAFVLPSCLLMSTKAVAWADELRMQLKFTIYRRLRVLATFFPLFLSLYFLYFLVFEWSMRRCIVDNFLSNEKLRLGLDWDRKTSMICTHRKGSRSCYFVAL